MEFSQSYLVLLALAILIVLFNSLLTKEIYYWVPSLPKKIVLMILIWCVPVLGFFLANVLGDLKWFKSRKSTQGSSSIAGGFLEADSVFNPGAKNTIEMVEKQKSEVHAEVQKVGAKDKGDR